MGITIKVWASIPNPKIGDLKVSFTRTLTGTSDSLDIEAQMNPAKPETLDLYTKP